MRFSIANLCFMLGFLVCASFGNEEGNTDLSQLISFPDLSICSGGALLQAVMADLVRRMSEMENTVRPHEDLIAKLEDRVSSLEKQLTLERTARTELEGRVNSTQETLTNVQSTATQLGDMTGTLKSDLCGVTPKLGHIFLKVSPAGQYKYDLDEARHACTDAGAVLATYHQLYEAWQDGRDTCSCGWLADGTARYPTQTARPGCGSVGINVCSSSGEGSYNAWCFRPMSSCD